MSFHPLKGQNVDGKELAEGPVQDMGKPVVAGIRDKNPVPAAVFVPVLKGAKCLYTGACRSVDFKNPFRKEYSVVNVGDLSQFEPNTQLDPDALKEAGLVWKMLDGVKLLGSGEISHPLVVRIHKISQSAREKIEGAGGRVEIL
jgi:large subunit ribosomal protein L15